MRTPEPRRKGELLLAVMCVVLVMFAGLIQVTHSHGNDSLSHPDCALCVSAHTTVSPSAPITAPAALTHIARIEVVEQAAGPSCLFIYNYRIRPPPVVPASV
jgi:hypothetical protein